MRLATISLIGTVAREKDSEAQVYGFKLWSGQQVN